MKHIAKIAGCLVFALLCVQFVGCKKNKTNDNVRTFSRYFSTCEAQTNVSTKTYKTQSFFDLEEQCYTTLNFVGDVEWTEGLSAQKVSLKFLGNKTCDVDIEVVVKTNGEETKIPKVVQFEKDKVIDLSVEIGKTFLGNTSISIIVKDPGKNNIAGSLFNENGESNGFVWKIAGATLFGSHK